MNAPDELDEVEKFLAPMTMEELGKTLGMPVTIQIGSQTINGHVSGALSFPNKHLLVTCE